MVIATLSPMRDVYLTVPIGGLHASAREGHAAHRVEQQEPREPTLRDSTTQADMFAFSRDGISGAHQITTTGRRRFLSLSALEYAVTNTLARGYVAVEECSSIARLGLPTAGCPRPRSKTPKKARRTTQDVRKHHVRRWTHKDKATTGKASAS